MCWNYRRSKLGYDGARERTGRETSVSLHQSVSVIGDVSEWAPNLLSRPQSLSRLVVPLPRHVPESSLLRDVHNEYGEHATLASLGHWLSHFLAVYCTTSSLLHSTQHASFPTSALVHDRSGIARCSCTCPCGACGSASRGGTVGGHAEMWPARAAIGPCAF